SCVYGATNSVFGSTIRPRSRQTTLRPAFASSMDMIEPTTPLPTTTASTGFILIAATLFAPHFFQHDVFGEALCVGLRLFRLDVQYAHRLRLVELSTVQEIPVVAGGHARKAQQLPADLPAVAAVHRVGEIAFFGVAPQEIEKLLRRHRRQ